MSIVLEQVSKHYNGIAAVNDVSVDIADGEFFVLLGPSGSGKSTLLRAIAGLTAIDHGRVVLHGRDVTNVGVRERDIGFVFQNYALFQHMNIADNIEFALRARGVKRKARRQRREELLKLVSLEGFDKRLPAELSGGQQQRVAVARALAHEPRLLLLDEPFGALDAKIREELRRGIREIQRKVGITTILVTHDQEEAFMMADRIGVMDRGRLLEVAEPRTLYAQPKTRFVATFLGAANLLLGIHQRDAVKIGDSLFPLNLHSGTTPPDGTEATVLIRPEDVVVERNLVKPPALSIGYAEVVELEFVGSLERIHLSISANGIIRNSSAAQTRQGIIEASRHARDTEVFPLTVGQKVAIGVKHVHVLPTRISSLRLVADSDVSKQRLKTSSLVNTLAERMQFTPSWHSWPAGDDAARLTGLPVIAVDGGHDLSAAFGLLKSEVSQVLALGQRDRPIQRLVIYAQASRPARDVALSVAGSLLRHLSLEATLLVPADEGSVYGARYRDLLDIRNAALRVHGVDVRTESFHGSIADELKNQLRLPQATLLLIGMTSAGSPNALLDELVSLTAKTPFDAILLTCARGELESAPMREDLRRNKIMQAR